METVGLIAAMPLESGALLQCIQGWERTLLGPFHGARFRLMNRECLLVTSGMGVKHAAEAARAVLQAVPSLHMLVSFGIAGAVNADLRIGDVIVAGHTCLLELGLPGQFWPLAPLSKEAQEAAAKILQPEGALLVHGTAITTCGIQVASERLAGIAHPILEMETAAIAQVAAERGIPLVSIRSISDGPQSPIPFDIEAILDENNDPHLGKLLRLVLCHPKIIFQSGRMIRNSKKAANQAAKALFAALTQPDPVI